MTALRRNMLACPELQRLDPLLASHRLTEAETGQVVLTSLKVELSKVGGALRGGGGEAQPAAQKKRKFIYNNVVFFNCWTPGTLFHAFRGLAFLLLCS